MRGWRVGLLRDLLQRSVAVVTMCTVQGVLGAWALDESVDLRGKAMR